MSCERVSERAHGRRFQALLLQRAAVTASTSARISIRKGCSVARSLAPAAGVFLFSQPASTHFSTCPFFQRAAVLVATCVCVTARRVIIIIRHILRINSLSRLLLFIYLFWSAYPASHKVTHECIALVILAVGRVMTVIMRARINIVLASNCSALPGRQRHEKQ
jgi:hypothetical protein